MWRAAVRPVAGVCLGICAVKSFKATWFLRSNFRLFEESSQEAAAAGGDRTAIVVGGGVVGLTTAYQLLQRGYRVKLLEGQGADGQHSASFGNAGTMGVGGMDHDLAKWSSLLALWPKTTTSRGPALAQRPDHSINSFFDPEVLGDKDWRRWVLCLGRLLLWPGGSSRSENAARVADAHEEAQRHCFELAERLGCSQSAGMVRSGRLTVQMTANSSPSARPPVLSPQQCAALAPILSGSAAQGSISGAVAAPAVQSLTGQGDCAVFCRALAARCSRDGGELLYNTPITRLLLSSDETVATGVVTAAGAEHTAGLIVVCAGASSSALTQTAGVFLPVYPLRGCSMTVPLRYPQPTAVGSGSPHVVVSGYGLYITTFNDTVRFVCYGEMGPAGSEGGGGKWDGVQTTTGASLPPLHVRLELLARSVVPDLDTAVEMEAAVRWTGSRPLTPDCQPIIGLTSVRNLLVNTGHSFNGAAGASAIQLPPCHRPALPPELNAGWVDVCCRVAASISLGRATGEGGGGATKRCYGCSGCPALRTRSVWFVV